MASASPPPASPGQRVLPVSHPPRLFHQPPPHWCRPPPLVSAGWPYFRGVGPSWPPRLICSQSGASPLPRESQFLLHVLRAVTCASSNNGSNPLSRGVIGLLAIDLPKCGLQDDADLRWLKPIPICLALYPRAQSSVCLEDQFLHELHLPGNIFS